MKLRLANIRLGFYAGIAYGTAFLLFEDLWAWTVLQAEFSFRQVLFSVVIYTLVFGIIGVISALFYNFSTPAIRQEKGSPVPAVLMSLTAFAVLYLTGFHVVSGLIKNYLWRIPIPLSMSGWGILSGAGYILLILLIRSLIFKRLRRGRGENDAVLIARTISLVVIVNVFLIVTAKQNAVFFWQEHLAGNWWLWYSLTAAFAVTAGLFSGRLWRGFGGKMSSSAAPGKILPLLLNAGFVLVIWWAAAFTVKRCEGRINQKITAPESTAPKVLFILIDALRADHLSLYGYDRQTSPVLDEYSRRGVVFTNAASNTSWTKPSVCSIFSSWYPGIHNVNAFNDYFPDEALTIAEILSENGYYTKAISTNAQVSPDANYDQGFTDFSYCLPTGKKQLLSPYPILEKRLRFVGELTYQIDFSGFPYLTAREANDKFLIPWLENNRDSQFFVYMHYMEPHDPYIPEDRYFSSGEFIGPSEWEAVLLQNGKKPDGKLIQKVVNRYDDEIINMDQELRRVFETLDRLHLWDNTLVIITADHGEEFYEHGDRRHGNSLYEESIHVPLIMFFPGGEFAGTVINQRVDLLDIAPTIYDYLKIEPGGRFDGVSLMSLIRGDSVQYRRQKAYQYSELTWDEGYGGPADVFTVTRMPFKYVETTVKRPKREFKTALYNLQTDRGETENIANDHPDLVAAMAQELSRFKAYCKSLQIDESRVKNLRLSREVQERLRALGYIH